MTAAPDYSEAVIGWRAWTVTGTGSATVLRGPVRPVEWPVGRGLEARCDHSPLRHPAPWPGCRCGIHAGRTIDEAAFVAELPSRAACVTAIGRVRLWGAVVEGERGWRAARAYPEELLLPLRRASDAPALREVGWELTRYGVPTGILDCTERGVAAALTLRAAGEEALASPVQLPVPAPGF